MAAFELREVARNQVWFYSGDSKSLAESAQLAKCDPMFVTRLCIVHVINKLHVSFMDCHKFIVFVSFVLKILRPPFQKTRRDTFEKRRPKRRH